MHSGPRLPVLGAPTGIGAATVRRAGGAGALVAASARRADRLESVVTVREGAAPLPEVADTAE